MGGYDEESAEASSTASYDSDESSSPRPSRSKKKVSTSKDGEALRPIAGNTPMELFAGAIAGASVASAATAMVLVPYNIVFAAGGLSW